MDGAQLWQTLILAVVQGIAEFLPISSSGHLVIFGDLLDQVFSGLVPILVPVLFAALHIFVSLLQAYIFMLLPAIYISLAVAEEH